MTLRIAYLLEDTEMAGGIRVAVAQADILTARGHDVALITKGKQLNWRRSRAQWEFVRSFEEADLSGYDFVVATFWRTVEPAWQLAGSRTVHFCQGYEGSFTFYAALKEAIDAVYRLPIPKITVSSHLVDICRQFYDDVTYIGQIVDDDFFQPRLAHAGKPRVLLVGPMQTDFKGIDVGYDAVRVARRAGADFDFIRASQWPAAVGEPVELTSEFHVGLATPEMAKLFASCDIVLSPSRSEEGFGLPAAEAMASGLAVILTSIPSFRSWSAGRDHAVFVDENDAVAMGRALADLVVDAGKRKRIAERGHDIVEQFRAGKTAERLEAYFSARLPRRTSGR